MKQVSVLIAFLVFLGLNLQAQSTTTVEKNAKRITITTTKVDESGKPITETWIAEGDQPEAILQNMAVNPEIMEKVEVDKLSSTGKAERLFLFRSAGDNTTLEGTLDDVDTQLSPLNEDHDMVIVTRGDAAEGNAYKVVKWYDNDGPTAWGYGEKKANCAALGVYVNPAPDRKGCNISSLIEKGGAQAAGLLPGDIITKLDDYTITDFPSLYETLAKYLPGDDVTVMYIREGKTAKTKIRLTSWADLPGHEWRARGDCGKVEEFAEVVEKPKPLDTPEILSGIEALQLEDARVYPNPTDGNFSFSFTTAPGPISISITDVNGKNVYQEENENATGYYNHDINLKEVPTGNYVLSVKQGDKIFTQQISKQ